MKAMPTTFLPGEHRNARLGGVRPWNVGAGDMPASDQSDLSASAKVWLREVSLSYPTATDNRLLALDHIDLKVRAGEFVCIVGPSGCGKSTLLHIISGLERPTLGSVLVDDKLIEGPATS